MVHKKPIYRGNFLKRGALTVFIFKGEGLVKKKGVFLWGVDTPMHAMNMVFYRWGRLYSPLETMLYYLTLISLIVAIYTLPITYKRLYFPNKAVLS